MNYTISEGEADRKRISGTVLPLDVEPYGVLPDTAGTVHLSDCICDSGDNLAINCDR